MRRAHRAGVIMTRKLAFLLLAAALPWSIAPISIAVVLCGALTLILWLGVTWRLLPITGSESWRNFVMPAIAKSCVSRNVKDKFRWVIRKIL